MRFCAWGIPAWGMSSQGIPRVVTMVNDQIVANAQELLRYAFIC